LLDPRVDFGNLASAIFQSAGQGGAFERVGRDGGPPVFFDEVVRPENVRVNEGPAALYLLAESVGDSRVAEKLLRQKVESDVFSEYLVIGEPDGTTGSSWNLLGEQIAPREALTGLQLLEKLGRLGRGSGLHGCGTS